VTVDHNYAKQLVSAEHWDGEHGPVEIDAGTPVGVFWIVLNIDIVYRASLDGGASTIAGAFQRKGIAL